MSLLVEAYDRYREHTVFDGEGIELAIEFELLALECGANPSWDRQRLVRFERSRKGGLATLARYGRPYYRALARVRWGKTSRTVLPAIRDALYIPDEAPDAVPKKPPVSEPRRVPVPDTPDTREDRSMTTALMITTAVVCAAGQTARLAGCLLVYLLTGTLAEKSRELAERTPVRTLMEATGTERKVLLFEWLLTGPVGEAFGPEEIMYYLFGGVDSDWAPDAGATDGGGAGVVHAILATRYDKALDAVFDLEACLNLETMTLSYLTLFIPMSESRRDAYRHYYAAWPDARMALMSYCGGGESEVAGVGLEKESGGGEGSGEAA